MSTTLVHQSSCQPRIGVCDFISETPNGISRCVESLIRGLVKSEFETVLFCRETNPYADQPVRLVTDAGKPARAGDGEEAGASAQFMHRTTRGAWRRLGPGTAKRWAGFASRCRHLARIFRREPVDLFHAQLVNHEPAVVAARMADVRRVLGTFQIDTRRSRISDWPLDVATNHALHQPLAASERTGIEWARRTLLRKEHIVTLPNCVDPDLFCRQRIPADARRQLGLPVTGYVIAAVGRLAEQKGFAHLIVALPALIRRRSDITVALAGDGELRQSLINQAKQLGLENHVRFLGFQADVRLVLEAADVFALPSLWEAMPFSLLEAMSVGLPCVATSVAGVPEVVLDGETGLLVEAGDTYAFGRALDQLLANVERSRLMGCLGRERIKRYFDERMIIARTLDLYREHLSASASSAASPLVPAAI